MIPSDVASRLQVSADTSLRPVAPAQEISDKLSGLVAGQKVMAEIQSMLPNGTYRAIINQRNVTLALPFSAKSGDALELQVTESDGKLALAVLARPDGEGSKPATDSTSATLSRTGQLISNLFSGARDAKGNAAVVCPFAGHTITIEYRNPRKLDAGQYVITAVSADGHLINIKQETPARIRIARRLIAKDTVLTVTLGKNTA